MRLGRFLCVSLLLASSSTASAQEPSTPAIADVHELRYELWLDATVTGGCVAWWILSEVLKAQLAPESCSWCDPPGVDRAVANALHWTATGFPDAFSYVTALAVGPVVVFGLDLLAAWSEDRTDAAWIDYLLIAEAVAISMAMNQTVKLIVGRQRPFVWRLDPDERAGTAHPSDNNLSFYSGHTTFVFALAVAAGTIATMRGYRLAPWIWAAGMTVAVATAYLRIAADRHYMTDVLTGLVAGSATGFVVPYFFHSSRRGPDGRPVILPAATADGAMITATWRL